MNKTLIAAAAAATLGSSAFAQSNVQIYGRVNVTIERQKAGDGDNNWVMQNNASRIGFRGTEDLGGGLKAGFQLEHRFNINTGQQTCAAAFWGCAGVAEVNLSGAFGTVRLGHFTSEAYYATADYVGLHNHDTGTSSDAFYAYVSNDSNKVSYRAPSFGDFTFEGAVTSGDSPNAGRRSYDLAANYDAGPLHLGAGFSKLKDTDAKQFAVRALYELGAFTVGGYFQRDTDGFGAGLGDRSTWRLAGMYAMGSTEFHLNYGRAGDYDNVSSSSANQWTLGVNQNLSKRTKVYGFYTKIADKGAGIYGDFQSLAVGVRHNF